MMKVFTKRINNRKGFTLIELIVVIAILGILALVAIPRFVGVQQSARDKANAANIATLRSAAAIAVAENGAPTANVVWTSETVGTVGGGAAVADTHAWYPGKFIEQWPTPPAGTVSSYQVNIAATSGTITITHP